MLGAALACGHAEPTPTEDGGTDDPDPVFSAKERAALEKLAPDVLPAPPHDASNRWADDPDAARFGQRLFFDPGFSGRLLDGDNDGGARTLGAQGETGRVSCAGCHQPMAGFSDARTLGAQISLAAGWGRRRTPSLLDAGQSTLMMWDGRHDAFYSQVFGVIESAVEMNSSRLYAARHVFLRRRDEYETSSVLCLRLTTPRVSRNSTRNSAAAQNSTRTTPVALPCAARRETAQNLTR